MAVSLKHTFTSAVADGADTSLVRPSNWNAEHNLTLAADRLLGRLSSDGAVQELTQSQALDLIGSTQGNILYRGASAWAALAAGSEMQALTAQGVAANPVWAYPPRYVLPYFTIAGVGLGPVASASLATVAVTTNRLYLIPIEVPYTFSPTLIEFYAPTQSGNWRGGIYSANQKTAQPLTLVANSEIGSTAMVANHNTASFSGAVTLNPGRYYLALVFDAAASLRQIQSNNAHLCGINMSLNPTASPAGMYTAHTFGALPDLTAVTMTMGSGVAIPIMAVR